MRIKYECDRCRHILHILLFFFPSVIYVAFVNILELRRIWTYGIMFINLHLVEKLKVRTLLSNLISSL
jgi:hypothetical protein